MIISNVQTLEAAHTLTYAKLNSVSNNTDHYIFFLSTRTSSLEQRTKSIFLSFDEFEDASLCTWIYVIVYCMNTNELMFIGRVSTAALYRVYDINKDAIEIRPGLCQSIEIENKIDIAKVEPKRRMVVVAPKVMARKRKVMMGGSNSSGSSANDTDVTTWMDSLDEPASSSSSTSPATPTTSTSTRATASTNIQQAALISIQNNAIRLQNIESRMRNVDPDKPHPKTVRKTMFQTEYFGYSGFPQDHALAYADKHKLQFTIVHTDKFFSVSKNKYEDARWYGAYKDQRSFIAAYKAIPDLNKSMYQLFRFDYCVAFYADIERDDIAMADFDHDKWKNMILPKVQTYLHEAILSLFEDRPDFQKDIAARLQSPDNTGLVFTDASRIKNDKFKASNHANQNDIMFETPFALHLFMHYVFYTLESVISDVDFWWDKPNKHGVKHVACIVDSTVYTPNRVFRVTYSSKATSEHSVADRLKPMGFADGVLNEKNAAEYSLFEQSIVKSMPRTHIKNAASEFLVPLITVDLVLAKCKRLGVRKTVLSNPIKQNKAKVAKGVNNIDLLLKDAVDAVTTVQDPTTWNTAIPPPTAILQKSSKLPKNQRENAVAFFNKPSPGKWFIDDFYTLLVSFRVHQNKTVNFLSEMRDHVCCFMIDFDMETSTGFLDIMQPQPLLDKKSLFSIITDFIREIFPVEALGVLIMFANGKKKERFKTSYTIIFYNVVMTLLDQGQLLKLLRMHISQSFGANMCGLPLKEVFDNGSATRKGTRMLFQDKLTVVEKCAKCTTLNSIGCGLCKTTPANRIRLPFLFCDEKGHIQPTVDCSEFIKKSLTRREQANCVMPKTATSFSTREQAVRSPVYLTDLQFAAFTRVLHFACGAPDLPVAIDRTSTTVSIENNYNCYQGYVKSVPCPFIKEVRQASTNQYHQSNRFRFFINVSKVYMFCLDDVCQRKGKYECFMDDLPADIFKLFVQAYDEGTT